MKLERFAVLGLMALLLLASPAAFASSSNSHNLGDGTTPLNMELQGLITNAGSQHYELDGGQLVSGVINGQPVSPENINFAVDAQVHDLSVSGKGTFDLASGFKARITIYGAVPAAIFPLNPTTLANCDPTVDPCNSEIPLLFTGTASIQTGHGDPVQVPIGIESAYWDPLGRPIVVESLNTVGYTFSFVVKYSVATITWSGVQLQGGFGGLYGSEPVEGFYSQTTFSQENLVRGSETDFGSIVFAGVSDPALDGHGIFFGHTSFSTVGSQPCPSLFPLPSAYCLETGATSDGAFFMSGSQGAFIFGFYHTIWSVPSLFTSTTVMATVY
jgi:hypothetical protein